VGKTFSKRPEPQQSPAAGERRRVGTVQHDERGNASVRWHDAPADEQRKALEILSGPITVKADDSFDPYARGGKPAAKPRPGPRKDLRKLSEHIKKMRELEARKSAEKDAKDED
jgi:hypothetical protein